MPAAGDDAKAGLAEALGDGNRVSVFLLVGFHARGAENGDTVPVNAVQGVKGGYHLGHDAERAPGFGGGVCEIVYDIFLQFRHDFLSLSEG